MPPREDKTTSRDAELPPSATNPEPTAPATAAAPAQEPAAAVEQKPTLLDHARATGNVIRLRPNFAFGSGAVAQQGESVSFLHAQAAVPHGWNVHNDHTAEPLAITEQQYRHALAAAAEGKVYPPAQSPFTPELFKKLAPFTPKE